MKKVLFLGIVLLSSSVVVHADEASERELGMTNKIERAQAVYKKKFRKKCGFSGVHFSRNHTAEEWKGIKEHRALKREFKKICPNLTKKDIKMGWVRDIYPFLEEYALDSKKVPSC